MNAQQKKVEISFAELIRRSVRCQSYYEEVLYPEKHLVHKCKLNHSMENFPQDPCECFSTCQEYKPVVEIKDGEHS